MPGQILIGLLFKNGRDHRGKVLSPATDNLIIERHKRYVNISSATFNNIIHRTPLAEVQHNAQDVSNTSKRAVWARNTTGDSCLQKILTLQYQRTLCYVSKLSGVNPFSFGGNVSGGGKKEWHLWKWIDIKKKSQLQFSAPDRKWLIKLCPWLYLPSVMYKSVIKWNMRPMTCS